MKQNPKKREDQKAKIKVGDMKARKNPTGGHIPDGIKASHMTLSTEAGS